MSSLTAANVSKYNQPSVIDAWSKDPGFHPIERELIRSHFPEPPARILDIGCGAGRTTDGLVRSGYQVAAIDLADRLLAVAQRRTPAATVALMSATLLGFRGAAFDAVLFSFNGIDCIYPESDRQAVFQEVRRVLVPGGTFYFSSHNVWGHFGRNARAGLKGWRANLAFLTAQRRNGAIARSYWLFPELGGHQLLHATTPRRQVRVLRDAGFRLRSVRGLKRYRDASSVALRECPEEGGRLAVRGETPASIETGDAPGSQGATSEHIPPYVSEEQRREAGCSAGRMPAEFHHGLLDAALRRVDLMTLTLGYPHIQYVASTAR